MRARTAAILVTAATVGVPAVTAHAAFPGRNGVIAFSRFPESCIAPVSRIVCPAVQIYSMAADGSGKANVSNTASNQTLPAFSPDGRQIAFLSDSGSATQVWVMNSDGSGQHAVTAHPGGVVNDRPAWSPDGTALAFTAHDSTLNVLRIFVVNLDGGGLHPVTTPSGIVGDESPAWSPDGTRIAFERVISGAPSYELLAVNVTSGDLTHIDTTPSGDYDLEPDWSPDSTKVVWRREAGGDDIWLGNADGSGTPQNLTNGAFSGVAAFPVFSPDGTQIAFEGEGQIRVLPVTGGATQDLSNDATMDDEAPTWQPLASVTSSAAVPPCSPNGQIVVHVFDAGGFLSPAKAVHYRVDGGAEQVVAAGAGGNGTISVPAGSHTVEYWGENQAGDLQAAHGSAQVKVDTLSHCSSARPSLKLSGLHHGCFAKSFKLRLAVRTSAAPIKRLTVFLDRKRVARKTHGPFSVKLKIKLGRLKHGKHRLRIVVVDQAGKTTTFKRSFSKCGGKRKRH